MICINAPRIPVLRAYGIVQERRLRSLNSPEHSSKAAPAMVLIKLRVWVAGNMGIDRSGVSNA